MEENPIQTQQCLAITLRSQKVVRFEPPSSSQKKGKGFTNKIDVQIPSDSTPVAVNVPYPTRFGNKVLVHDKVDILEQDTENIASESSNNSKSENDASALEALIHKILKGERKSSEERDRPG